MIKVLNIDKANKKYRTKCQCGAELEFETKDVRIEKHTVWYGGDCFGKNTYERKYIICPNCKEDIYEDVYNWEEIKK